MDLRSLGRVVRDDRCPLGAIRAQPPNEGIVGEREIGLLKPTALFINTARGQLVDQAALTKALAAGRIGAVALDVFAEEPLPVDDPLLRLHDSAGERVMLTPHNAWQSPWTWVRDSQRALAECTPLTTRRADPPPGLTAAVAPASRACIAEESS